MKQGFATCSRSLCYTCTMSIELRNIDRYGFGEFLLACIALTDTATMTTIMAYWFMSLTLRKIDSYSADIHPAIAAVPAFRR